MEARVNKVSYLVALYNKEKFIIDAVESILNDNCLFCEVEVCIVDDGSTDNSLELLKAKYINNKNVKIEAFEKNKGKNAAYNFAFEISSGNFISLLGADDEIIKGRTQKMLHECIESNSAIYGGLIKKTSDGKFIKTVRPPKKPDFKKNILQNSLSGGCLMMHRSQAEKVFPIPQNLKFEDWWISFHLLRLFKVKTISEPVLIYNIHENNDSGAADITYESAKKDLERHSDYLIEFSRYIISRIEKQYLQRAIEIRKSFLETRSCGSLLHRPFDKSWLKLLTISALGARKAILLEYRISNCRKALAKAARIFSLPIFFKNENK